MRGGSTGKAVPGYVAKIVDDDGNEVPRGTIGRLAVQGPTGCRYLADPRQTKYVQNGWNFPGDTYVQDADGYFMYQARSDDMIVSSGYNIAGPEVEEVLLSHPAVAECGVVGAPDEERGHIVKAYIVLRAGHNGDAALTKTLQDFVKNAVAPYKYPRAIEYVTALPRTQTGKLQRFELRKIASEIGRVENGIVGDISCQTLPLANCRPPTPSSIRPAGRSREAMPTASRRAARWCSSAA